MRYEVGQMVMLPFFTEEELPEQRARIVEINEAEGYMMCDVLPEDRTADDPDGLVEIPLNLEGVTIL